MIADNATLGYVATACARGGDLDSALTILRRMTEKGMSAPRTYNLVLLAIANGKTGTQPPPAERCVVGRGWTATGGMVLLLCLNEKQKCIPSAGVARFLFSFLFVFALLRFASSPQG